MTMLLSDYWFKKREKKLSNTNYLYNRGGPAFAQDAFCENLLLYHCTTQVIPFITAAATKISRSYSKRLAGNLPWKRVKFPVASNRMEGTKFEVSL